MAIVQLRHAEGPRDLARQARAHSAMRVADIVGELHLLAALEYCFRIGDDLRVEAVGHRVAPGVEAEAALALFGVDLGEDRVQVEVVEMLGATTDLTEQFGAADHLVEALHAQTGEDLAHLLGDEGHQVDDLLGRSGELGAQALVLRAHADRAGVAVALAHHDTSHRHQAERADAIFLGAQDRRDHDIATSLQTTISTQLHPAPQPVEGERLVDLAQAHLPRRSRILHRCLRRSAGAADMAGDEDDVGMRLGDARSDRADAR